MAWLSHEDRTQDTDGRNYAESSGIATGEPAQDVESVEGEEAEAYEEEGAFGGDSAVANALGRAGSAAGRAAKDAGQSLAGGFSAILQVRRAAKERADAQADVRELERGLEEDRNELAHREDVERNYAEILNVQGAELADAMQEYDNALAAVEEQRETSRRIEGELRALREENERSLRPYRNLMESSRGRSDDAAKALASIRRSLRSAEGALNTATKNRQQRIEAANRAVDNARERMARVQSELAALEADETASASALEQMRTEYASEQAHLQSAQSEVVAATSDAQQAVDKAQQNLWALQRDAAAAEQKAADAKQQATTHKNEYDTRYKQASAAEKAQEDALRAATERAAEYAAQAEASDKRADAARDILEEAEQIHAHPETTQGLRERIATEEADLALAEADARDLADNERALRRSTRGKRIAFVVAVVLVVALIAFLVWWFALRR